MEPGFVKVVFCIKTLVGARGGAERVFTDIVHYLVRGDYDVTVVTFDEEYDEPFYPLRDVRWIRLSIGNPQTTAKLSGTCARVLALRRAISGVAPDVVVGFMHSMYVPLALALFGTGIPVVGSEHTAIAHYKDRKLELMLLMLASLILKKITVLSSAIQKSYPIFVASKMVVVPNPVKCSLSNPKIRDCALKKTYTLLTVGRLDKGKDFSTLIAAFSRLADRHQDWYLNIAGEGLERPALEAMILTFGLENRVKLLGAVRDIEEQYARADLFVMPSRYESFGLALAEAMSFGIPGVGFLDCPGVNEVISSGENGLLVRGDGDRVVSLAEGLDRLMSNPSLRKSYGEVAKQFAAKYSIGKIGPIWEKLLLKFGGQKT